MFIAPYMEAQPHCYNELDISPTDVPFQTGIYNKNLNQSGIVGTEFGCEPDFNDITHRVMPWTEESHSWEAQMSFSWALVNCPYNCPLPNYCGHTEPNPLYRANFYRINELQPLSSTGGKCTSGTDGSCEYMAWNPTLANPPAFHVPPKFGFLAMI